MAVPTEAKKGFYLVLGAAAAIMLAAWISKKLPG